jgi:hypothetical protein
MTHAHLNYIASQIAPLETAITHAVTSARINRAFKNRRQARLALAIGKRHRTTLARSMSLLTYYAANPALIA